MVDAVTSQTILNGPRNCVMKFTNVSDGTGEAAVLKVDVSALGYSAVNIVKAHYSTTGMGIRLLWDATTDVTAVEIGQNQDGTLDFTNTGGLPNNSGAGKTGDILLTTIGATSGDSYTLVLEMTGKRDL